MRNPFRGTAAPEAVTIDFDLFTPDDWADIRAIAKACGIVRPELCEPTQPPLGLLAGYVYATMRRTDPRITPKRCVEIAADALGVRPITVPSALRRTLTGLRNRIGG